MLFTQCIYIIFSGYWLTLLFVYLPVRLTDRDLVSAKDVIVTLEMLIFAAFLLLFSKDKS